MQMQPGCQLEAAAEVEECQSYQHQLKLQVMGWGGVGIKREAESIQTSKRSFGVQPFFAQCSFCDVVGPRSFSAQRLFVTFFSCANISFYPIEMQKVLHSRQFSRVF